MVLGNGTPNVLPAATDPDGIDSQGIVPLPAYRAPDARTYLRSRRREIVADMAARLLAGQDPDKEILPFLYRALAAERIVDASIGFVVTEEEDGMKLGFAKGFPDAVVRQCVRLDFGQAICGTVAKTRRAMHVTDIQRSLDPLAELVRSAGIAAYACEPLIVGERLLGTLSFASRTRGASIQRTCSSFGPSQSMWRLRGTESEWSALRSLRPDVRQQQLGVKISLHGLCSLFKLRPKA